MGPCPFRHGNLVDVFLEKVSDIASMGPCPFRHGNASKTAIPPILYNLASMGPCPFRHGNTLFELRTQKELERLQWGHVLSDMVT